MKAMATHSAARNAPSALSAGRDISNIRLSSSWAVGKLDHDAASQPLLCTRFNLNWQEFAIHPCQVLSQIIR
jgi:hypothetical protein